MNLKQYNYFSDVNEWNHYSNGFWIGSGISMILSEKEPYEDHLQTRAKWDSKKGQILCRFRRSGVIELIHFSEFTELFADKLILFNPDRTWKGELQAMTEDRFHLHVTSLNFKNALLFSGTLHKTGGFLKILNLFY